MGMYEDYKTKLDFYRKEYGDRVVLLYQIGFFFEVYHFEDSKSQLTTDLDIRLTRKDGNKPFSESNPFFSGFPCSALNKFINKLVNLPEPYIVVVIEQTENGNEIKDKKNVQRRLKGIYTKNVLPLDFEESVEDYLLVYKDSNWCLFNNQTNELIVYENQNEEMSCIYLSKYKISQIIVIGESNSKLNFNTNIIPTIKKSDSKYENLNYCDNLIQKVYKNSNNILNEFTLFREGLTVLCYTLDIIYSFNEKLLKSLSEPVILNKKPLDENLNLYLNTIRQLSLDSLRNYINNTSTAIGSRKLKDVLKNPYYYKKDIDARLNLSKSISTNFKSIAKKLSQTTDFVKLHRQVSTNYFTPEKFKNLYDNYSIILTLLPSAENNNLQKLLIKSIKFLEKNINLEFNNDLDFFSDEKFPESLIKLKEQLNNVKKEQDELLFVYSKYDSQNFLKIEKSQDSIFLKITAIRLSSLPKLKELLLKHNCKMSSVGSGSIKIMHPKLNILFIKINEIENNLTKEFNKYFTLFCEEFTNLLNALFTPLKILVEELDLAVLNNKNKEKYNYNCPTIIDDDISFVNVKDLRHPIIEQINDSFEYITNDINLNSNGNNGIVLFGVNASGKSSLLKSLGVSVVMAQAGLYGSYTSMELCPYNNLLTQVDMNDDMMLGESSFTNELIGIKEMFKISKISNRTLILADELTCGTENNSAIAIFGAVILELIKYKVSFFFTTHLQTIPNVSSLQSKIGKELRFYHLKVLFKNEEAHSAQKIIFERKLQEGPCIELYGLEIARSLIKENSFLIEAESIRKEILGTKSEILENKKSRYNSKKIIDHCEICKYTLKSNTDLPLDVHHINFQCNSNKTTGIVNDKHFHKNALFNLVTVCKDCHIKIHKKEIIINGYIKTNLGKELDYTAA